ncbi:efflux RND transporter permease subunit [Mangrovitalea sediminis]|uniref:efflux RND transporter permease subunit n=1 Tax=Mangrovitalea sediminis TaxID=1982043 RepID=UPI000BE4D79D|nr:efflux RND transporter permease subunit [Mangrovitalea sediminis]
MADSRMGIAGSLARRFQNAELTPLLALVGVLLGIFAIVMTPKEEEPQIDVTFANVFIPFPGASPKEVESLVATPAEQVLSELRGIKHVWSTSTAGMATLTVQFKVGESRNDAIVRLYNKLYSNADWLPKNLGVGQPLVKPKGIDDVPVMSLTLWSDRNATPEALTRVAHTLETALKRLPGTREIRTVGAPDDVVHVVFDPAKLAVYHLSLDDLRNALQAANTVGQTVGMTRNDTYIPIQAGTFLSSVDDVRSLVVGLNKGQPIYLGDIAKVTRESDTATKSVFIGFGQKHDGKAGTHLYPAITLSIAKKPGANAIDMTRAVNHEITQLHQLLIPQGVHVTVTRDYGVTAADKASKLILKLAFATASVVLLVLFTLGWREAIVVGSAVIITLLMTLFASWAWGFTLNRVSLFALIFSIGILVDDAIVVVENIHRHLKKGHHSLISAIPAAVDEVGGPTILATFTVIAALMPMAFVSGLMGPYMSPIPINASTGMLISLAIAFIVTPWFSLKLLHHPKGTEQQTEHEDIAPTKLDNFFTRILTPFLRGKAGRAMRWGLVVGILVLIGLAMLLPATGGVILKMLPFDNKSEFQVVVDMPEGTPVERTQAVLGELAQYLQTVPEVTNVELYAGTAAPINFNGLVRQYYLRSQPNEGDLQVNLVDKHQRDRQSHAIALAVRGPLDKIAKRWDANIKIVEVPPGPPVQAPIVAEIYGPSRDSRIATAHEVRKLFEETPGVVDIDDTLEAKALKYQVTVDRAKAARLGVAQQDIVNAITAAFGGEDVSYLHDTHRQYPVPIRLEMSDAEKARLKGDLANLRVRSQSGKLIALSEVTKVVPASWDDALYHKDGLPVIFVTGDDAGKVDSPLYGMFEMVSKATHLPLTQYFIKQPPLGLSPAVKWDGEWQITYETFRDMGLAYGVGMILIYLLVVGQFRSYLMPLVIMAPIPLTIIGVMPGHALLGAQFTATSMIGMIALAGIIVRNSILLVDFIQQQLAEGVAIERAVVHAAAIRARPIILTALAAMIGAFFILDDPIFNGLAISLIFGILVSTLLTLIVIPVLFYALRRRRYETAE